jgi:hypothetical protein
VQTQAVMAFQLKRLAVLVAVVQVANGGIITHQIKLVL